MTAMAEFLKKRAKKSLGTNGAERVVDDYELFMCVV